MAMKVFNVGDVLTAADVNTYLANATYYATKTGNTSRASTTTSADDPDITVTVAANSTYEFQLILKFEGATGGDMKYQINTPGGARLDAIEHSLAITAAAATDDEFTSRGLNADSTNGALGAGVECVVAVTGQLVITTGGVVKLQWAQASSNATPTIMKAGTFMLLKRIA